MKLTTTAAIKTAATPTIRYGRLRSAVSAMNVFISIRCSCGTIGCSDELLAGLDVDGHADRVGEDDDPIARGRGEPEGPLNNSLEVLHLAHLEQAGISGLEVHRPAVRGMRVRAVNGDEDAVLAQQLHGVPTRRARECRVGLWTNLDAARLSVLELDRHAVIPRVGADPDGVDVCQRRRRLRRAKRRRIRADEWLRRSGRAWIGRRSRRRGRG